MLARGPKSNQKPLRHTPAFRPLNRDVLLVVKGVLYLVDLSLRKTET